MTKGGPASVVLAAEVGGRWNAETAQFISALAKARSSSVPEILQARVEAAWIRRWSAILACSAARAFSVVVGSTSRATDQRSPFFTRSVEG